MRNVAIEQLAAAIESIQHRGCRMWDSALPHEAVVSTGWRAIDQTLGGGLTRGAIHEWFSFAPTPCAGKFWIAPLAILTHLAWRALDAHPNHAPSVIIWIGRTCWP